MRIFSSLRRRLIFSALFPGILAGFLLIGSISWVFLHEMSNQRNERWNSSMQLLTQLAAPLLRPLNLTGLKDLGVASLNIPSLRSVTFYDTALNALDHAGPQAYAITENSAWPPPEAQHATILGNNFYQIKNGSARRYFWPLYLTQKEQILSQRSIVGWVDVEFSTSALDMVLYKTIIIAILAALIITCLSVAIAIFLHRHSNRTLSNMLKELRLIKEGERTAPLSAGDSDEVNILIDMLNETISALQHQLVDLKEHIDHSTHDLRETLETIEIQSIELDLARKEALQASKMKSEFLANTSHEIRTPLNGIIGFTRLLLKNCNDSQQQEYLTTIQHSSEALLNIINDILDLSKIEAGKLVLDYSSFNIHSLTEDTLQNLAPAAHEKGLELVHIIATDVPEFLYGDPSRIRQILINLIGNAIKFSNTGGITVRIALVTQSGTNAVIKCSVSDSGIGIRRSQLNQDLFNAFTQGDNNNHQQRDGTGLGLAISKKLVNQMGGDIGIDSEEHVGSTFWFTLKLDIDQQTIPTQFYHLPAQSVLLFDSNATSRQAISYMLTHWGMNVSLTQSYNDIIPALSSNAHLSQEQWYSAVIISVPPQNPSFPIDRLSDLTVNIAKYCPTIICAPTTLKHYLNKILDNKTIYINKPVTREKLFLALQSLGEQAAKIIPESFEFLENNADQFKLYNLPVVDPAHCSILVVDDNPANLKLLSHLLADMGHRVQEAKNGEEAISRCRQDLFDIIFMDIRMPGMDGIEATQRIRSLSNKNKSAPVIAVTAHALTEQKQQLLMSGLDDYLSKPLDEMQLRRTIARWVSATKNKRSENQLVADINTIEHCIDITLSLELSNGNTKLAADMLFLLLNDLESNYIHITRAFGEARFEDALDLIHKMHGATCYCGTPKLKEACKNLEKQLHARLAMPTQSDILVFNEAVEALLLWNETYEVASLFN